MKKKKHPANSKAIIITKMIDDRGNRNSPKQLECRDLQFPSWIVEFRFTTEPTFAFAKQIFDRKDKIILNFLLYLTFVVCIG